MRIANKQKAIKTGSAFLELLRSRYNRSNPSYLYVYTWVDIQMDCILDDLKIQRKPNWYYPRIDWESKIKDLSDNYYVKNIDPKIKLDAINVLLGSAELSDLFDQFIKCFK